MSFWKRTAATHELHIHLRARLRGGGELYAPQGAQAPLRRALLGPIRTGFTVPILNLPPSRFIITEYRPGAPVAPNPDCPWPLAGNLPFAYALLDPTCRAYVEDRLRRLVASTSAEWLDQGRLIRVPLELIAGDLTFAVWAQIRNKEAGGTAGAARISR